MTEIFGQDFSITMQKIYKAYVLKKEILYVGPRESWAQGLGPAGVGPRFEGGHGLGSVEEILGHDGRIWTARDVDKCVMQIFQWPNQSRGPPWANHLQKLYN